MRKKTILLIVMCILMLCAFTGCVKTEVQLKLNENGKGTMNVTAAVKKDIYESLKLSGSDLFQGKEIKEVVYDDIPYIAYTEQKEYNSYNEIQKELSSLKNPQSGEQLFEVAEVKRNKGIFYNCYSIKLVTKPQTQNEIKIELPASQLIETKLTIEMPNKITQSKGGTVTDNKFVVTLNGLEKENEILIESESYNIGIVLVILGVIMAIAITAFILIRKKK